jgi:hypothetical protein
VQELTGWREPLPESQQEGTAAAEHHAAADSTANLTAERSSASAAGTHSNLHQQQQQHPATPGSAGHPNKEGAFVTPRTSFSCDPRNKGKGRFAPGSVCKDSNSLFGGASADDVGHCTPGSASTPGSARRGACSEGGVGGSASSRRASGAGGEQGTPLRSRAAAEAIEAKILAKIATVCTPGHATGAAVRKSMAQQAAATAAAIDSSGRPLWQD